MGINFVTVLFALVPLLGLLLLPAALVTALQVWLCRKSLRLGLILPGISLCLSVIMALQLAMFSAFTAGNVMAGGGTLKVTDENGTVIQEEVIAQPEQKVEFHPKTGLAAGAVFLVFNIPTIVFGGIWLHFMERQATREDLKRMRIEDLE